MGNSLFVFINKNNLFTRFILVFTAVALLLSWLSPLMMGRADAIGQLTLRSVTLSSGVSAATGVTYSYGFTTATAGSIQSIKFVACTSAFQTYSRGGGTSTSGCTAPNLMNINQGTQQGTNGFGTTTAFSRVTSTTGNCAPANNVLCVNRTQAASESAAAKTVAWNTQTNPTIPSGNGYTFYIGVYTYSDNAFATNVDSGTVASAVVQTLTVNAQVAEVLAFCVGSTTVNDISTSVAGDCSGVTGTSLNLGTLDSSQVNVSPWSTDGGDSQNGVAMLRTNAASGATVAYDAIQAGTGTNHLGTLRLSGASCNAGSVQTDGCINAAGASQTAFTAGLEKFGMTVAGINSGSTSPNSYTCAYGPTGGNTCNLEPTAQYIGNGTAGNESFGSGNGFAWVEGGTATTIVSSASSTIKQVDDEAIILAFAATPSITTPFGAYSVQADFVATPTF
jgi:hypothetical protein